jgi:hypothetical protein
MKHLLSISGLNARFAAVLAAGVLAVAGCDSASDVASSVRTRLAPRQNAQTRTYAAAPRVAYDAAIRVAKDMGYRITKGGPAEGVIEALSGVDVADSPGSARQVSLTVHLRPSLDGGTEVTASFEEIYEADSSRQPGLATEAPLRGTPQYEVFFRSLQDALRAGPPA